MEEVSSDSSNSSLWSVNSDSTTVRKPLKKPFSEASRLINGKTEDPEIKTVENKEKLACVLETRRVAQTLEKEKKFPRSVFFIVGNEFCERFSYYGMRTVLTLYLTDQLNFSDNMATVIFHVFSSLCYFTPVFGAMLADSFIGKFNTIFYVSIVYATGNIVLSLAATPPLKLPMLEISMLGLALIAVGTGGIKPCVSAFGGDQFDQDQARQRQRFFSIFYFSINAGSLISTFLTPVFRADVKCFGSDSCFPLAFGVPAVLMIIAIGFFLSGKRFYRIIPAEGNVVVRVFGCIKHALGRRCTSKGVSRDHWLDYADDKYDGRFIKDVRAALRVMYLYLPLPIFWALYDQQGSRWTLQATRMDGALTPSFSIQPDQMQVVNALLILFFIPVFDAGIYPVLAKCNILTKPLKRMFTGGILAGLSFVIAALIQMSLENSLRVAPLAGHFDVTFVNALPCNANVTFNGTFSAIMDSKTPWTQTGLHVGGYNASLPVIVRPVGCSVLDSDIDYSFVLDVQERNSFMSVISVVENNIKIFSEKMTLEKSSKGNADVRIAFSLNTLPMNGSFSLKGPDNQYNLLPLDNQLTYGFTGYSDVFPDKYAVYLPAGSGKDDHTFSGQFTKLVNGGVYTLIVTNTSNDALPPFLIVEMEPNQMSMFWQLPQYIVITAAEILFSITGLEFSYSQAPVSMKSVLQAAWLLTTAFGDLIVVIVAEAQFFERQSNEFFLFAGLMVVVMIIFWLMAHSYEYVSPDAWSEDYDGDESKRENGASNDSDKRKNDVVGLGRINKGFDRELASTEM